MNLAVRTTPTRTIPSGRAFGGTGAIRLGFVLLLFLLLVRLLVFLGVFALLLINLKEPWILHILAKRHCVAAGGVLVDPCLIQFTIFSLAEAALTGEIQPVASAIKGGIGVVELATGDFVTFALGNIKEPNTCTAPLGQRLCVRKEGTVVADTDVKVAVPWLLVDHRSFGSCKVHHVGSSGLVLVDQLLGIREPLDVGLEWTTVLGELLLLALAIGRHCPQFVLAGGIIEVRNPLSVRAPCWRSLSDAVCAGQVAWHTILSWGSPDVSPRCNGYALCTWADA